MRQQLFSDQEPVFAGEHAYRAVISADDAHGMVVDDNLRMYIGRGTKVYLLPLRHRNQVSFDITALNPDGTWAPDGHEGGPPGDGGGLRRADRRTSPATSTWTPSTSAPSTTSTRSTRGTPTPSSLMGDAAHAMLHHQGQGANSAILDAGALADALLEADSVPEALAAVPGDPQAGHRRAAAHLPPGLDRGRARRRLPRPEARATHARGLTHDPAPRDRQGPRAPCPRRPPGPLDPAAMRAGEEAQVAAARGAAAAARGRGRDRATPSGDVPVRIYTPVEADSYGLLVYFHGGAFFLGSLDTHDHVARSLAKETGLQGRLRRLPPGARGRLPGRPRGLLRRWSAGPPSTATSLGWDGRTLAIAGDSSGGNFVAAVAAMAHDDGFDGITHQVLFYPSLDLDFDVDRYASLRENAEGYGLETAGPEAVQRLLPRQRRGPGRPAASRRSSARTSPGCPPALIITAEHDPLRDEGELYGRRLRGGRGGRDRQPVRRRRPRVRPALLLDPGVPPGVRGDRATS